MKILIGGNEDAQGKKLSDEFYKNSGTKRSSEEGFEAYFKQDNVKIMGLKDPESTFPNGSKMTLIEEKNKYTLFVEMAAGNKREYNIDSLTRTIKRDSEDCSDEERDQVIKMLRYMKKFCTIDNSETKILHFEKKGVI